MSKQFKNGKCSCWTQVERRLRKCDVSLDLAFGTCGHVYLQIATCHEGRSKKTRVLASYCPFCGNKLHKEQSQ